MASSVVSSRAQGSQTRPYASPVCLRSVLLCGCATLEVRAKRHTRKGCVLSAVQDTRQGRQAAHDAGDVVSFRAGCLAYNGALNLADLLDLALAEEEARGGRATDRLGQVTRELACDDDTESEGSALAHKRAEEG